MLLARIFLTSLLLLLLQPAAELPAVRYLPAPGGAGLVIAVESVAPEVSVLQKRSGNEWTCEGGHIDYWYEGDSFAILEVWRGPAGVERERRTEIPDPHFEQALSIIARP